MMFNTELYLQQHQLLRQVLHLLHQLPLQLLDQLAALLLSSSSSLPCLVWAALLLQHWLGWFWREEVTWGLLLLMQKLCVWLTSFWQLVLGHCLSHHLHGKSWKLDSS